MPMLASRRACAFVSTLSRRGGLSWRPVLIGAASLAILNTAIPSAAMAHAPMTTFGYSRATVPGIPGAAPGQKLGPDANMFAPQYFIYVSVEPGSQLGAQWAWVQGKTYDCALKRVSAPVVVDSDVAVKTDKKETLVPKTSADVYQVVLGALRPQTELSEEARKMTAANEAVVALTLNGAPEYATVGVLKALPPAAAM
jgi:hypothetical protein